jgi:hypothetical protein
MNKIMKKKKLGGFNKKNFTSWTPTLTAPSQCFGSAVMVSVLTAQPSLPESLWSSSIPLNGGFALCASHKKKKTHY